MCININNNRKIIYIHTVSMFVHENIDNVREPYILFYIKNIQTLHPYYTTMSKYYNDFI